MLRLTFTVALLVCWTAFPARPDYVVYIDPGHSDANTTWFKPIRSTLEVETNLEVGLKLKQLLKADSYSGIRWVVKMSREDGEGNSPTTPKDRARKATDLYDSDLLLSIHCNGGEGTGTETFWCDYNDEGERLVLSPNRRFDEVFARRVQNKMVMYGEWTDRQVVEDFTYVKENGVPIHLGILRFSKAPGCLNEIGFVDNPQDAEKLRNDKWRDKFAKAYLHAIYEYFSILPPEPALAPLPSQLDFPETTVGKERILSLDIKNTGTDLLGIGQMEIRGRDAAEFKLVYPASLELRPGKSYELKTSFSPTSAGDKEAELQLHTNVPGKRLIIVALKGQGKVLLPNIITGEFTPGDRVRTTTSLKLRRIPGVVTDSNLVATLDPKARGVILADPGNGQLYNTANRWWLVEFSAYGKGWVAGAFLVPDTSANLAVESIRLVPSQPSPKKEVEIIFKVINYGPAHIKEAYLGFYFDDKPAEYFRGSLDAGSSQEYKQQLSWPDDLLNHKIVVIASYIDAMPDLDFTNNTLLLNISAVANAPEPSSDILPSLGGDPPETNGPVTNNPNPNPPPSVPNTPIGFVKLEPLAITLTPSEPEKLVPAELGGRVNGRGTYDPIPFPDWFYHHQEGNSIHLRVTDYSQVKISQTFTFFVSSDTMRYRDFKVLVISPTDWEKQLEDAKYLDVPAEYQTIAAALEKAESGQTVRIAAGEYNVSNLNLKTNLTLEGNNSILNLSSGEGYVLRTEAKGVKISNLTLKGIGKDRTNTSGLYLGDGAEVVLNNVSFLELYSGIESQPLPSNGQGTSLLIQNSQFQNCQTGLSSSGGGRIEVKDSQFLNNQHIGLGIYFPKSLLIENVTVSGSKDKAIYIQDCRKQPAVFKNLTIKNNREGVYLEQSWAEISNSNLSENQLTAILVRGRVRLTKTSLKNNGSGLYFGFSSTELDGETKEISHCQIIGNKEIGIQIYHQSSNQTRVNISNSDIFNNNQANLNLIDQLKTCSISLSDIFWNTLDEKEVRQTITVPDQRQLNLTNLRSTGAVDSSLRIASTQKLTSVIAYVSAETGQRNIFLIDPDGNNKKQLTNLALNNLIIEGTELQFSPNGDWLAFRARHTNHNNWDIWLIKTTGQELHNITNHPSDDQFPVWLTDDTIAFTSYREGGPDIWKSDLQGRNQQKLLALAGIYSLNYNRAVKKFAFVLLVNNTSEVHTINLDGSSLQRLTDNQVDDSSVDWSPDGKEIVFSSQQTGYWEIYLMAATGDKQRQLTFLNKDASNPSFSPDGQKIVFNSSSEIYTMNSDGQEIKKLTNNNVYDWNPVWSPALSEAPVAAPPAQVRSIPSPPLNSQLLQNYPNPFNPDTWIPYQLKEESRVTLLIHDAKGVIIRRIELGLISAGVYTNKAKAIHWDGRNGFGEQVASGSYFYTIQTNHFTSTKKLVIGK